MEAEVFFRVWRMFFVNSLKLTEAYKTNSSWSEFVLGDKKSGADNSNIGNHIKKHTVLKYRKEDGLTDIAFYKVNNMFSDLKNLNGDYLDSNLLLNYPKTYDILFEHENDYLLCYEEILKLTYSRARLKVLVTYIPDDKHIENNRNILAENFENIIKKSNEEFRENAETEYLLLIGCLKDEYLFWTSKIVKVG